METEARTLHHTHDPELDVAKFVSNMTCCRVCMRFVSGPTGVTNRGTKPCPGPTELRSFFLNS